MKKTILGLVLLKLLVLGPSIASSDDTLEQGSQRVRKIVQDAVEYWRGETSHALASMNVHRPDWQRVSELESWTKGTKLTLVRFVSPKKDAGNASLTIEDEIWTFTPKTNRVIKIPASMKSQSWMGSDFSYQDLSKDDEIIDRYEHRIISESTHENKKLYEIESIPHESAPIVWGKEILKIREDHIIIEHTFYDQEMLPVKKMETKKIALLGGKLFPVIMRMRNLEKHDEWTEIVHHRAVFGSRLADSFFTVSSLKNPR